MARRADPTLLECVTFMLVKNRHVLAEKRKLTKLRAAGDESLVSVGGTHPVSVALPASATGGQAVHVAIRPESLRLIPSASTPPRRERCRPRWRR